LVIACLFALGTWHCGRYWRGENLPTDAELRQQFTRNRAALERLRQMVSEDRLTGRVHADNVDDKKLSEERLREYRRLMKSTGVERLVANGPGKPIDFNVDDFGFLDVGTYKGFYHDERRHVPSADSLDLSCRPPDRYVSYCEAFQKLDGNWWLIRYEHQ
jgi:hypothetical protein